MDGKDWVRLNRLLDEALDLSVEDRELWLAGMGPEDDALKPRLLALLSHEQSVAAAGFLDALPKVETSSFATAEDADQAGAAVGPYRLLRKLGEGGMGTVWLADRPDGMIRRVVALKLPRGAWPARLLVERMARERDILAALTHPHIARLYDAGVTSGGRPYLALEYVEGRPIDEYCNERGLEVPARLGVFLQVADAVGHAHAKLVIHRDLKPSNILVTVEGQVRLLDFGIAKLLDGGTAAAPGLTDLAGRPHTPAYASPEQIAGESLNIATDIYSLGVVLYELLTGTRPYRPPSDSRAALENAIGLSDPDPPSASAIDTATRRALRGDLDTILLKALKKDPADRYATVNAFGDDIRRFLDGRPVVARPDRVSYRVRKFVRRNAVAVGAAAAIVTSLVVFAGVSAWQAYVLAEQRRVAQVERDTSEQVVRVLVELFESTNPSVRPDGDRMPLGEFLSGAQERSLDRLRGAPAVRAKLQQVFGLIHYTRGQYSAARDALEEALREQRLLVGSDHPDALESLQVLGEVAHEMGDDERARALLDESLERHRRLYSDRHERTARVLQAIAPVVAVRDLNQAGELLRQALEIRRATLNPHDPGVAETLGMLGGYHYRLRDYVRAKDFYREALAIFPTQQDRRHPVAITILNDFSVLLGQLNAHGEAEALQREAVDLGRQVLGPETATVANLVNNLGVTQATAGRHHDAEASFRASFETHRSLFGERHPRTANAARNVGRALFFQQRYDEALSWMDRASAERGSSDPSVQAGRWGIVAQRAQVLFRLGRHEEALSQATDAVESLQRLPVLEAGWPLTLASVALGRMLVETGRPRDAEPPLKRALAWLGSRAAEDRYLAEVSCELARARLLQGSRAGEEVQRLQGCLPIYRTWGLAERRVVESLERLLVARAAMPPSE